MKCIIIEPHLTISPKCALFVNLNIMWGGLPKCSNAVEHVAVS